MSSASELDAELSQWLLFNYILLSAFVLYSLHYIHTVSIEFRAVWCSRPSGTSILFLLNRHGFMLNQILNTIGDLPGNISRSSCVAMEFTSAVLNTVTIFSTALLLLLRVYAIYGLNRLILAVGLLFIIPVAAANIYLTTGLVPASSEGNILSKFTSCTTYPQTAKFEKPMDLLIQFLPLASETLMFSLMVYKVGRVVWEMQRLGQKGFLQVLQRDGLLCYIALLAATIIEATPDIVSLPDFLSSGRGHQ